MKLPYSIAALVACTVAIHLTRAEPAPSTAAHQPPNGPPVPANSDALDGTWELVSVIEDGNVVPLDVVKQTMIKDGRVVLSGALAAVVRPDGKLRTLAFVTDPKASPKTVDIAGDLRVGGKGIYLRDGDVLMICTRGSDSEARPALMASLPNSDTFLMTFKRVNAPQPVPVAKLSPPATPAVPADDPARRMLVGTWGHQNEAQVVKATLNSDGTYSVLTTYKKGMKKLFDAEDRKSGNWRVKDGEVVMTVTASTTKGAVGQVHSYRITSISDSEVLYIDNQSGQRRIEWKLR